MDYMFKGNGKFFHVTSIFYQLLRHLKDLDKRFSWGVLWAKNDVPFKASPLFDGKTTSKSGLALNGTSYYGKLRIARSGGSWL